MPETKAERVMFALGLAIIGVLVAAIVAGRNASEGAPPATPTTAQQRTVQVTSTSHQRTVSTVTTPRRPATTTAPRTPSDAETRLQVTARDDTWLSIRRSSATGAILFEGTLTKGERRTYTATQFHIRFGAAANITATLDGKPLALPSGTYSVDIGVNGLGPRSA